MSSNGPTGTRIDGVEFQFSNAGKPGVESPPFKGVLHLFEHKYDEDTTFWYGVGDIQCLYNDVVAIQSQGAGYDFMVIVTLPDGRSGACLVVNGQFGPNYSRIAMFGRTKLH